MAAAQWPAPLQDVWTQPKRKEWRCEKPEQYRGSLFSWVDFPANQRVTAFGMLFPAWSQNTLHYAARKFLLHFIPVPETLPTRRLRNTDPLKNASTAKISFTCYSGLISNLPKIGRFMEKGKAGIDSLHKYLLIKYGIDHWSVIDLKIASTREKRGSVSRPSWSLLSFRGWRQ